MADQSITGMSLEDRFGEVLKRTLPLLPGEMQEQFAQLLSPLNLGILTGTLAVWAASHAFGWGFVADLLMMAAGFVFLGMQVIAALGEFVDAVKGTAAATTSQDLDVAAKHMAGFISIVGVAVFTALVFKGAKKIAPRARSAIAGYMANRYGGMTPSHFRLFQNAAKTLNRIIAVRNTNPKSTPWIERGFPGKPMEIKIKTSKITGIVTCLEEAEIRTARSKGFYVVDADGVPRNQMGEALKMLGKPQWPVEPGQVIHPTQMKPLVGDYDLLGVINPKAPGRNLVLAAKNGEVLNDWSSPEVRRVAAEVNAGMDQPRVMHGAQDGFGGLPDKGGSTVFFPDGSVLNLETPQDVEAFYQILRRQTITGKY